MQQWAGSTATRLDIFVRSANPSYEQEPKSSMFINACLDNEFNSIQYLSSECWYSYGKDLLQLRLTYVIHRACFWDYLVKLYLILCGSSETSSELFPGRNDKEHLWIRTCSIINKSCEFLLSSKKRVLFSKYIFDFESQLQGCISKQSSWIDRFKL